MKDTVTKIPPKPIIILSKENGGTCLSRFFSKNQDIKLKLRYCSSVAPEGKEYFGESSFYYAIKKANIPCRLNVFILHISIGEDVVSTSISNLD